MNLDSYGPAAPPRRNGELAFDAPWQSRVFAVTEALIEAHLKGDREPFRRLLISAIASDPGRPYWDSWTAALEQLTIDEALLVPGDIDGAVAARS